MNDKRKFYKTTITIEVLSEDPIPGGMELNHIYNECMDGGWSMLEVGKEEVELNEEQMVDECLNHGTDAEFFGLDSYEESKS